MKYWNLEYLVLQARQRIIFSVSARFLFLLCWKLLNPLTIYLLMLASPSPLSYFILMLGQSFVDTYAFACRVNVFKRSIDSFRDNSLRKAVAKGYAQQFKFLLECCHFNDAVILEEITGRRWVTWSRLYKITCYVFSEVYYLCYFL